MKFWIWTCLLTVSSLSLLNSCSEEDDMEMPAPKVPVEIKCVKPDYLKPGDKVAMISPSYYTPMENVEKTAEVLRSWGLEPVIGPNVGKIQDGKYRGGYGTIQLIDLLLLEQIKASQKWIVGFSDISTIHGLWNRAGVMSVHGTMSSFLAKGGKDETSTLMRDLLLGSVPRYVVPAHKQNIIGKASGVLVGGNICTFAPNVGSQADATMGNDLILFIEEVEESMHNIDRQMRLLQLNGVLNRCKGIILGEFVDCGSEFTFESVEAMLYDMLAPYHIPVLCGFPAGHGDVNLPLVMGAPVTIDVRNDGATLQFNIDGTQHDVFTSNISAQPTPAAARLMMAGKSTRVQ